MNSISFKNEKEFRLHLNSYYFRFFKNIDLIADIIKFNFDLEIPINIQPILNLDDNKDNKKIEINFYFAPLLDEDY